MTRFEFDQHLLRFPVSLVLSNNNIKAIPDFSWYKTLRINGILQSFYLRNEWRSIYEQHFRFKDDDLEVFVGIDLDTLDPNDLLIVVWTE